MSPTSRMASGKVPNDWKHLQERLHDLMEWVWNAIWTPESYTALESLRQRVVFGGGNAARGGSGCAGILPPSVSAGPDEVITKGRLIRDDLRPAHINSLKKVSTSPISSA